MNKFFSYIFIAFCLTLFYSCQYDKGVPDFNGFPEEVGKIITTQCAVSGCHNDKSKEAAGGLSLESWDKMFEGGRNSVCVIPYRSDYSTMCFYINTFPDLGPALKPTMPFNKDKLNKEQVTLIRDWINSGAQNNQGFVKFSDNSNRKKIYVTNQGCDVVTVFDKETLLPMRYIDVATNGGIQSPHYIKVDYNNQYWYVLSLGGNYLEKYRCSDDAFVAKAFIGSGNWNTFSISKNSQTAYCIDLSPISGKIATVNLATMTANVLSGFNYPHGSALNKNDDTLYVTQQYGSSKLYKIPANDFSGYSEVNLYTTPPPKTLNAHEILFTPDGSKYFVTCQGTDEVRVFQAGNDQLLASIPVGGLASEMSFSTTTNYLFVTCTEDTLNFPGKRGSVAVIDYINNQFVKYIYTGHQPHGVAVDDEKGIVVIANRNNSSDGPSPHHTGACAGRNGNVTFIDMNTLDLLKNDDGGIKRIEVSVDPYSAAIRN